MAPVIRRPQLPAETRKLVRPGREEAKATLGAVGTSVPITPSPEGRLVEELKTRLAALGQENAQFRQQLLAANEQAERDGYAHGVDKGTADGQAAFRDKIAQLDALIDKLQAYCGEEIGGLEDMALGIAHATICRILGEVLPTRDGVLSVVRQVIAEVREQDRLVVRLAPDDFALLAGNGLTTLKELRPGQLEVLADSRVELAGCLVDTSYGSLDARIETQLRQLRETLQATRARRAQEA